MRQRVQATIRGAKPSDAPYLMQSTFGNALESEGLKLDPETVKRGVEALLADSHKGRIFVAEVNGEFAGSTYVSFEWSDWHAAWYWWIQSAYTAPAHRGQGVWTALYQSVLEAAKHARTDAEHGPVRAVRLYVESENEQGLRAYNGHSMKHCPYEVFEQVIG